MRAARNWRSPEHKGLATTQRYMHLSPRAIESAIRLLDQSGPTRGSAERGDPDAQFQLARLLKEGVGVRLNRVDDYKWLELAATQQADEDIQRRASTNAVPQPYVG